MTSDGVNGPKSLFNSEVISGSGVACVSGEAPIEQSPNEKFCVEYDKPLCESILWVMLSNYYKNMAIKAWAHDYVPSFVTSNSRLTKSYSNIILGFLKDWYKTQRTKNTRVDGEFNTDDEDVIHPVTILEIGGGHGRFTFLLLKHILKFQEHFEHLGLPKKPFLYIFSDVAEANVAFCIKHPSLQKYIRDGWLDFAIFDGNRDTDICLKVKNTYLSKKAPVIAICNYVLDSLLTDAWRITPTDGGVEYSRAHVSVYSPQIENDRTNPDIVPRMTLKWSWHTISSMNGPLDDSSHDLNITNNRQGNCDYYLEDQFVLKVLKKYAEMKKPLSFVVPIGAFSLFQNLRNIGNGNLFCLIGDKGYPTADEFVGQRDPHVAIHGSISFMLNLDCIRKYFECWGGFHIATPYRDTFQVTGLWKSDVDTEWPNCRCAFIEDLMDLAPDSLIAWQRACQETSGCGSGALNIRQLISLLRYSGHDADIILNFAKEFTTQCVHPYLNPRTEQDLLKDLHLTFENWYKLKSCEDLPDICGHICMRLGKCEEAIKYLKASIEMVPEAVHAASWVNLASCYKVVGKFEEGLKCCEEALILNSEFPQALAMMRTLKLCLRPIRIAFLGTGYWSRYEAIHLLKRDSRFQIKAIYAFKQNDAEAFKEYIHNKDVDCCSGNLGLSRILQRDDIDAIILDLHLQLLFNITDALTILDVYKPYSTDLVWHAVENNKNEEAFNQAADHLSSLGRVTSVSIECVTDAALQNDFHPAPYSFKELLALELLRSTCAVKTILRENVSSVAAYFAGNAHGMMSQAENTQHTKLTSLDHSTSTKAGDAPTKHTRLRKEAPRISGWLTFTSGYLNKNGSSTAIPALFIITHSACDNSLMYTINCVGGSMQLSKSSACWKIEIRDGSSTRSSFAVQSVGHQESHDAFAEEIWERRELLKNKSESTATAGDVTDALVDSSISAAIEDSVLISGILTSIQKQGVPIRFTRTDESRSLDIDLMCSVDEVK